MILKVFFCVKLFDCLVEDFFVFFDVVKLFIVICFFSLLEDFYYQFFVGIYFIYMIFYLDDKYEMFCMLSDVIKGVYVFVFFRDSKVYMQVISNVIDQEKMVVIL